MSCQRYTRRHSAYRREETIWAASGYAGGMNLTVFDYPKPLCLFFNGSYGDKVWDIAEYDLSEPVGDCDSLLGEFRLFEGVFHTVVPWWGIREAGNINKLGKSHEMKPWSVGGHYDRPVARRIAEQAGVPRHEFGQEKLLTASNTPFNWPFASDTQRNFCSYLRLHGLFAPPGWLVALIRMCHPIEKLLYENLFRKLGTQRRFRPWNRIRGTTLLFQWANHELREKYLHGLRDANVDPATSLESSSR